MIKIHKHLVFFIGALIILLALTGVILYKYGPLFLHQTIYYCQEFMALFFPQIPKVLVFLVGAAIVKLVSVFAGVYFFGSNLPREQVLAKSVSALVEKLNLAGKVFIFTDSRLLAFCRGIFRPKIYLSTGLAQVVNCQELEAVLRHEKYHLDHRDGLAYLVASITLTLFPHFPVLADLIRQYRLQRELNADQAVVEAMNGSGFIISVIRKFLQAGPATAPVLAPALAEWDTLELRIKSLVRLKTVHPRLSLIKIVFSLVSAAVMLGLIVAPLKTVELHRQRQDVMLVCLAR